MKYKVLFHDFFQQGFKCYFTCAGMVTNKSLRRSTTSQTCHQYRCKHQLLGIALSAIDICERVFDTGCGSKSRENNNHCKDKRPKLNSFFSSFDDTRVLVPFLSSSSGSGQDGPWRTKTVPGVISLRDV